MHTCRNFPQAFTCNATQSQRGGGGDGGGGGESSMQATNWKITYSNELKNSDSFPRA